MTLERATAELETAIAAIDSPWRVAYDGGLDRAPQQYAPDESVTDARKRLEAARKAIRPFQRMLYAQKRFSVLLVFQVRTYSLDISSTVVR